MDTTILAAIITLLGTVLTVYVGFRQWKHQQSTNYPLEFGQKRFSAYEELWNMLPGTSSLYSGKYELELSLTIDEEELKKILEDLRLFCLQNELYIDIADRLLVMQYINGLLDFRKSLDEWGNSFEILNEASKPDNRKLAKLKKLEKERRVLISKQMHRHPLLTLLKVAVIIFWNGISNRIIRLYILFRNKIVMGHLNMFNHMLFQTLKKPSLFNLSVTSFFILLLPLWFPLKHSLVFKQMFSKANQVRKFRSKLVKRLRLAIISKI